MMMVTCFQSHSSVLIGMDSPYLDGRRRRKGKKGTYNSKKKEGGRNKTRTEKEQKKGLGPGQREGKDAGPNRPKAERKGETNQTLCPFLSLSFPVVSSVLS